MTNAEASNSEYERIMTAIRNQLTGDPTHDGPLLLEYSQQYRKHPLAREIVREIGRMLAAGLPQDARASIDDELTKLYQPFDAGLSEAESNMASGDADEARRTLKAIIEQFDPNSDSFQDDAVTEYRMFLNVYEAALYHRVFQPQRVVRRLPCDLVRLYLLYGVALVELRDLDAAERALRRARGFNPVNPMVLFELAEVFKLQQRWPEFYETSTFALSASFGADHAAHAYRNLGFYYIEQGNFDLAAACYLKSASIDKNSISRCAQELMYIEHHQGRPLQALDGDAIDEALAANGIQVGVSDAVQKAIAEVDGLDPVEQDIIATVQAGLVASNVSDGPPEQLAALLLSCAGKYRDHPKTPQVLSRIGWMLADQATPDQRAKLCVAITRLAEGAAAGSDTSEERSSARMNFLDNLELRTTHAGPEGTVTVSAASTGLTVAQYDFAKNSMTINEMLARKGSDFPPAAIKDGIELLMTYVGELTRGRPS